MVFHSLSLHLIEQTRIESYSISVITCHCFIKFTNVLCYFVLDYVICLTEILSLYSSLRIFSSMCTIIIIFKRVFYYQDVATKSEI